MIAGRIFGDTNQSKSNLHYPHAITRKRVTRDGARPRRLVLGQHRFALRKETPER